MAREDEPLIGFAERVGADPYRVLCLNPEVDEITDELQARPYRVPIVYVQRTEIVIDAVTGFLLQMTLWDDGKRLYERYQLRDVVVDAPLRSIDFDPENPAYDF